MKYGEAQLEMALRQVDRAVYEYESEVGRQAQPKSNAAVRKFCVTTLDIVNKATPILQRGGAPATKALAGITTFFDDSIDEWGSKLESLSKADLSLLHKCLLQLSSLIERYTPRFKW